MLSAGVPKMAGGADAGPSRELRSAAEHDSHWKLIEEALNIFGARIVYRIKSLP